MILIFSSDRIEGLSGTYATATLASEGDVAKANLIYTDNKRIIQMAKKLEVTVRDFPKHPPSSDEPKEKLLKGELTGKASVISSDEAIVVKTIEEPEQVMTLITNEELIENDGDTLTASSSIEDDIRAGMSTPDLKRKYEVTGKEVGALRRTLKAK